MKRVIAPTILAAILAVASTTPACGFLEPRPDTSRFFVLASLQDLGTTIDSCDIPANASIGLGPVSLPEYLDEPALLSRASPTELTHSYTDRWSEALGTMIPRVLADDLSQILHTQDIVMAPWYSTERPDWQIEIDVVRFEPDANGDVSLIAQWRLSELAGAGRSQAGESRIKQQASSLDPAERARAMSAALGTLAGELAHGVCALASK